MKTLSWIFPFNVFADQRQTIRILELQNAVLRKENRELQDKLNAQAISESIQITAMTSAMMAMCEQRVKEYKQEREQEFARRFGK